jgi:hypothetical protein
MQLHLLHVHTKTLHNYDKLHASLQAPVSGDFKNKNKKLCLFCCTLSTTGYILYVT